MAKLKCIPARYTLAILGAFAMGIVYGTRTNLNFAIVAMVNHTAVRKNETVSESLCPSEDDDKIALEVAISEYVESAVPGGMLAERLSAKYVMLGAVFINIAGCVLVPPLSYIHYGALLGVRFVQGLTAGVSFPTMNLMVAKWALPNERSTMCSIIYSGTSLGTMLFSLVAAEITKALGWEFIFYIEGAVSSIWILFWLILITDTPETNRFISDEERELLMTNLSAQSGGGGDKKKKLKIPLVHILKSPPFWAIFVSNICSNWGWYMLLTQIPTYLKKVVNIPIKYNAILSSIPYLGMFLASLILSKTLDYFLTKGKITLLTVRRVGTLTSSLIPALCLIGLCFIGCNRIVAVILLIVAVSAIAGMFSGFLINQIDIAPNFAGTITGITNGAGTLGGILAPIFLGSLLKKDPSIKTWRIVFIFSVGLYVIEIIVYMLWASGDVQYWNNLPEEGAN